MIALRLTVVVLGIASSITAGGLSNAAAPGAGADWRTFTNWKLRYSFRYPSNLETTQQSVREFGIEGLVDAVDLKAVHGPTNVLRVLVIDTLGNPRIAAYDRPLPQKVRKAGAEPAVVWHDKTREHVMSEWRKKPNG
jgi:hypothetical protein